MINSLQNQNAVQNSYAIQGHGAKGMHGTGANGSKAGTDIGNYSSIGSMSYYKESINMEFKAGRGDTVSIDYDRIELSASLVERGSDFSGTNSEKFAQEFRDVFLEMKREIVDKLFNRDQAEETKEGEKTENNSGQVPEYWNAENTSQRIVDFATSFFSLSDMERGEYADMMKDAIMKGFEMARGELGALPEGTESLVQDTYDLSLKKLDEWKNSSPDQALENGPVNNAEKMEGVLV